MPVITLPARQPKKIPGPWPLCERVCAYIGKIGIWRRCSAPRSALAHQITTNEEIAMPARVTATVSQSNTALICVIDNPSKGVNITEAAQRDSKGSNTALTVAPDGQSFQVPINTVGTYIVGVTVNNIPSPAVNISEGTRGGTLLLALYPENVAKTGTFTLAVTI